MFVEGNSFLSIYRNIFHDHRLLKAAYKYKKNTYQKYNTVTLSLNIVLGNWMHLEPKKYLTSPRSTGRFMSALGLLYKMSAFWHSVPMWVPFCKDIHDSFKIHTSPKQLRISALVFASPLMFVVGQGVSLSIWWASWDLFDASNNRDPNDQNRYSEKCPGN